METPLPPKFIKTALTVAMVSLLGGVAGAQAPAPQSWRLTGNAGTNPNTDFLGTQDNQPLAIKTNGAERLRVDTSGNVGIGTANPTVKFDVAQNNAIRIGNAYVSSGDDPQYALAIFASNAWYNGKGGVVSEIPDFTKKSGLLEFANDELVIYQSQTAGKNDWARRFTIPSGGNVEVIGSVHTSFASAGNLTGVTIGNNGPEAPKLEFNQSDDSKRFWLQTNDINTPTERLSLYGSPLGSNATNEMMSFSGSGYVGIWTTNPQAQLDVAGMTRTTVLQITGGSDLAEPFEASEAIKPGMVVAIDPERPGRLRIAGKAYDHTVAGIVSGANGINPGLTMGQQGTAADGSLPLALTGRVYCWADASNGPISPGDLLTSSSTPGHAMKVTDYAKAHGAIIGKAMTGLAQGKGLVLVLVTLQ
jgi:hypothetical protein